MSTVLKFVAGQVVGRSNVGSQSTSVVAVKLLGFPEICMCKLMCFTWHAFDFTCNKMVLTDVCLRFNIHPMFFNHSWKTLLSLVFITIKFCLSFLSSGIKYILAFLFEHWFVKWITLHCFSIFFCIKVVCESNNVGAQSIWLTSDAGLGFPICYNKSYYKDCD